MAETDTIAQPTKRIAAIDLGTNSFHAVLVDIYPDGSFRTIDKLKEMVILAEKGMENYLSESAMERGLEGLKRIKFLCDSQNVEYILACATSAIREAKNGGDFIQRANDELGIKVRAISGTMEAEMIGYAIRHSIALNEEMVLMVDIGGGSVEFIVGNSDQFHYFTSIKLGVARMAAQFINSDPISKKEIGHLQDHFRLGLREVAKVLEKYPVKTIIGSSGTMENVAAMIAHRSSKPTIISLNEFVYSKEDFRFFYDDFIKLNKKKRLKEKYLEEKRVDIINPGIVLIKFLIDEFNIENVKISEAALRDGMIIDYITKEKKKSNPQLVPHISDPRERSIYELLRKCHWFEDHSTHVAKMALQIFNAFKKDLGLLDSDRELLKYAAFLHDIGYYISHSKHHKHALYIIKNSELRGFNEDEINIMAHVARYHRRSTPKKRHEQYKVLHRDIRKRIEKLAAILRVADGLDRSHFQNVQHLEIKKTKHNIAFLITTEGDPELEIWGATRKSELFEKVTGKSLKISAL